MATDRELTRKKKVRGGHRLSAKRGASVVDRLLDELDPLNIASENTVMLKQHRETLKGKLEILKQLDDEILDLVKEDDIEEEIQSSDRFAEIIQLTIGKIEAVLCDSHATIVEHISNVSPEDVTHGVTAPSPRVKLPKLDLKKFNGDVSQWHPFWDRFQSSIHEHPSLTSIDKFNYLNSLLIGTASDATAGLPLTAANYDEAIAILKKRFGNKQQIINKHMDILLNVDSVTSSQNLKGLRQLHDAIETHIRTLSSLGVPSKSYGSLLSSIVMNKIPNDLRLIITREIKDEWELDRLLEMLRSELEARERVAKIPGASVTTQPAFKAHQHHKPCNREQGTATALLTNDSGPPCTYCKMSHASNTCTTVTNIDTRKDLLRRSGRCFVCLRRNHISRECRSKVRCHKCGGRHHISICQNKNPQASTLPAASNTNSPMPGNPGQAHMQNQDLPITHPQPNGSPTALYVNGSSPILLQTAKAEVYKNGSPQSRVQARILLDSGSQRTYVTSQVKEDLGLPSEGRQSILIKTFGSTEEKTQTVDIVHISVSTQTGGELQLTAYVVPFICEPLQSQSVARASQTHRHLQGIKLADYSTGDQDVRIDILVGSDQYWNVVTGKVKRGEEGPTAMHTKLGWVLSGPTHGKIQDQQCSNLVSTHVLKSAVQPLTCPRDGLEGELQKFWELESLGIQSRSVHEELVETITLKDNHYEVQLPWKSSHSLLPDNYQLSQKRLHGLLKRLRQDPEILKEYDAVIRDQMQKGIVEEVKEPTDGEVGKVHYLPHHAVIRRDKSTTKLRIVYDASARSSGPSLNDCLPHRSSTKPKHPIHPAEVQKQQGCPNCRY